MRKKYMMFFFVVFVFFTAFSQQKPYTIMIYMNGSDLESDFGLATDDLAEMLDSGLNSQNANVIILTGGANHWQNDAIPEYECIIWQLSDGWLNELKNMGNVDMGKPETLRDFISYSMSHLPAKKYGLIMWDHGGGSIAGFGHDENFGNSSLTLLEMVQAFEEAGLREKKLEFLGFDACLMATVEMAVLAADYAHVLIASEDLEPGDGWDYHFLSALNDRPNMCGICLGKIIVDTFMDFYGPNSDEILTLSVVDLARVQPVMDAMGRLMAVAGHEIFQPDGFNFLAERRAVTKTFGEGSPRDNYADMVDIGDMALQLYDLFPQEVDAVLCALKNCVMYNRHNSNVELWGLSTFYIYGGKSIGQESLGTYDALEMDGNYTAYLHEFFSALERRAQGKSPIVKTELALWDSMNRMVGLLQTGETGDFLWPKINGHHVPLFPIASTANSRFYAIPAEINGQDVDIIVRFSQNHVQGRVMGARNRIRSVFPKGLDIIQPDDRIAIYYQTVEGGYVKGSVFVAGDMNLTWNLAPAGFTQKLRTTDACGNVQIH